MWPVSAIIGVAVAGAVVLFATGGLLACAVERRRHRHLLETHGLGRSLSTYHRPKLSANEHNYSHITPPTACLRRSMRVPHGLETFHNGDNDLEGDIGGEDDQSGTKTHDHYTEVLRPRGGRSIRRSFHGHSLNIPKTRRLNKIRKVMAPEQMHNSPLSAITEYTDSPPCISPTVAESPTEPPVTTITPEMAPMKRGAHASTQWPLASSNTRQSDAMPTEVMSIAARASILMRIGGGMHNFPTASNGTMVPRSVSAASMTSSAPDDPLPPLPSIEVYKRPRGNEPRNRTSNTSLESIGSSVLGTTMSSPSHAGSENPIPSPDGFTFGVTRAISTPKLQVPPERQAIKGLCTVFASIRSLHPTVEMDEAGPDHTKDKSSPQPPPSIITRGDSFKVIDASNWDTILPLRIKKTRAQDGQSNRHSMYEPSNILQWRCASDSAAIAHSNEEPLFSFSQSLKRPASVAIGTQLQWDRQGAFALKRHSLSSLDGSRRGHKRQNCVRITNLPLPEQRSIKVKQLPKLQEEQHTLRHSGVANTDQETRDDIELQQSQQPSRAMPRPGSSLRGLTPISTQTPSPFKNRPILTPSMRPALLQYAREPSSQSSGTPRPDSEIFDFMYTNGPLTTSYNSSPRQWPLSPTPQSNIRLDTTPPSAGDLGVRQPYESPTLPSPALKSLSLYPRRSLVKGPRNPRNSSHTYRTTCPSPLQNKQGGNYRVSKDRDCTTAGGRGPEDLDLRKSVMMLRSMNSEGRLLDHHSSRIYRNVGGVEESSRPPESQSARLLTPPLNKRVQGLRVSSCSSPSVVSSKSPSPPVLDKYSPRGLRGTGSSPLAQHVPKFTSGGSMKPVTATSYSHRTLEIPYPALISASPSAMSVGGASIWEDASVRGESPEPENIYTYTHSHGNVNGNSNGNGNGQGQGQGQGHVTTPLALRPRLNDRYHPPSSSSSSSSALSYDFRVTPPTGSSGKTYTYSTTEDQQAQHSQQSPPSMESDVIGDIKTSRLVQHLERAASSGQWDKSPSHAGNMQYRQQHAQHTHMHSRRPHQYQQRGMDVFQQSHPRSRSHTHERGVGLGLHL